MFTLPIRPSFYDLDFGGVANNIAYLRWMEDARTQLINDSPLPLTELRTLPVVRRTLVDYHAPLRVGEEAVLEVGLSDLGRSAWTFSFRFLRASDGVLLVTGSQYGCFVHLDRLRPVPIPEPIRAHLLAVLRDE
jgi:YbgC/YbaW family acyl-CoA thioester hydrolase